MHSAETITTTILHLGAYSSQRGIRLDDWAHTMTKFQNTFITARCYASAVQAMGLCLSVCLCPSVTSRCSTKTAKRRITQTIPHDTTGTLVFWCQDLREIRPGSPPKRAPNAGGVVKIGDFRQITGSISKTVKDRHIVSIKVE